MEARSPLGGLLVFAGVWLLIACGLDEPYELVPLPPGPGGAATGGGGHGPGGTAGGGVAGGAVGGLGGAGGDGTAGGFGPLGGTGPTGGAGGDVPDTCSGFEPSFVVGCLTQGAGGAGGESPYLRQYTSTFDSGPIPTFMEEWGANCPGTDVSISNGHLRVVDCDGETGAGSVYAVTHVGSVRGCLANVTVAAYTTSARAVLYHYFDGAGGSANPSTGSIQVAVSGTQGEVEVWVARWDSPDSPTLGIAGGFSLPVELFFAHDVEQHRICAGVLDGDVFTASSYQCVGCWNDDSDDHSQHLLDAARLLLTTSTSAEFDDINVP